MRRPTHLAFRFVKLRVALVEKSYRVRGTRTSGGVHGRTASLRVMGGDKHESDPEKQTAHRIK